MFNMFKSLTLYRISKPIISISNKHWNLEAIFQTKNQNASFSSAAASTPQLDVERITKGNEDLERKLKVLQLEVEVMRQEGKLVPDNEVMKEEYWSELLSLNSISARKKYLTFLFKRQKTRENDKKKREQKRLEFEAKKETLKSEKPNEDEIVYGLLGNNIFLRFYESTMNRFYNYRLIQAMMFGQKLVIDCGYDVHMSKRENTNCAKQLMMLFGDNRLHDDPFDIHFCNANFDGDLMKHLEKNIPTMHEPDFPINVHKQSYLDMFPKQDLIYLTPHCREELKEYDHDAIYIIGAIVDKSNNEPVSLAKAKKEGIRMAKFPLDTHLEWGSGSGKSLTVNQCLSILNDVKTSGDWKYALRHVPRRKLVETRFGTNIEEATRLQFDQTLNQYKRKMGDSRQRSRFTYKGDWNIGGRINIKDYLK